MKGEKVTPIVESTAQSSKINPNEIGPDDSVSDVQNPVVHHHAHPQHLLLAFELRQKRPLSWNELLPRRKSMSLKHNENNLKG